MTPIEIDAMGKPCPMPLLMLKKALKKQAETSQFLLKSSDPNSQIDILRYCEIHNIRCTMQQISSNEFHYLIEK